MWGWEGETEQEGQRGVAGERQEKTTSRRNREEKRKKTKMSGKS